MAVSASGLLNRIVLMSLSKTGFCEVVTGLAEFSFPFYKVVLILRAVRCVAYKTVIILRFVAFSTHKRGIFMAGEALVIPCLLQKEFIVRGMRIMAG